MNDRHEDVSSQKASLAPLASPATGLPAFWAAARAPLLVLGVLLVYALVLFSKPDQLFRYSTENLQLLIATAIAAVAVFSLLIRSGFKTNRALHAEHRARARMTAILESITEGFIAIDHNWRLTYVNAEGENLLGQTRRQMVGKSVWEVVPGMDAVVFHQNYLRAMEHRVATVFEAQTLSADRIFEVHTYPSEEGISVYFRDVTEQRQARARLQASEERYRDLVENANDLVYTHDLAGNITSVNTACVTLTGFTHGELLRMNLADLIAPDHLERARSMLRQKLKQGSRATMYELEVVARDGRRVPVEVSWRLMEEKGRAVGVHGIARDISERKRAEEVLRNMSLTDPLTGVYNRRGAITLAEQQLKVAQRLGRTLLIVYADLNHLKQINDTYGHTAGDAALLEVAEVLQETFRESDIIARIGGDEFVVLAMETTGVDENTLRRRLVDSLAFRNARGARPFDLSLSIGIARFDPERARAFEELMGEADRRMYEDKRVKR